jgi:hypothetical protein
MYCYKRLGKQFRLPSGQYIKREIIMKSIIGKLKVTLLLAIIVSVTGCASMMGLDRPGVHNALTMNDDGTGTAVGVVTRIKLQEYRDVSGSESFGRGLASGVAGLLGPVASLAAAGADMAYESKTEKSYFQILTINVEGKEYQVIQMTPNEDYPDLEFSQDFEIGDKVLVIGDINTPIHAEHL